MDGGIDPVFFQIVARGVGQVGNKVKNKQKQANKNQRKKRITVNALIHARNHFNPECTIVHLHCNTRSPFSEVPISQPS